MKNNIFLTVALLIGAPIVAIGIFLTIKSNYEDRKADKLLEEVGKQWEAEHPDMPPPYHGQSVPRISVVTQVSYVGNDGAVLHGELVNTLGQPFIIYLKDSKGDIKATISIYQNTITK